MVHHVANARPGTLLFRDWDEAYTSWRNHPRDERWAVWRELPHPVFARDAVKVRRDSRYILLNPSRAGLVEWPLAWPYSTHRDAVGLMVDPVRAPVPNARRHHAYVSADPTVWVDGSPLPDGRLHG